MACFMRERQPLLPASLWSNPVTGGLSINRPDPPARTSISLDAGDEGTAFLSPPFERDTEITGPSAAKLFVSSTTADADVFAILRVFTPDLREVVF
jgi:predicted acyl esterase